MSSVVVKLSRYACVGLTLLAACGDPAYYPADARDLVEVFVPTDVSNDQPEVGPQPDTRVPTDTTLTDTTLTDTTPTDTTPTDTSPTDTSPADTTPADTSLADTSLADTNPADTNVADTSTPPDATDSDTGPVGPPWLPLGTLQVRTPDATKTGTTLYRSAFGSDLLPLRSPRLRFGPSGPERDPTPTIVRTSLDKLESLRPGFVKSNTLTFLAEPEILTLVEGDILEIRTWAGNYTETAQVIQGIELGGLAPETLLDGLVVEAATGGGAVTTVISPLVQKRSAYFGQRLDTGRHGGFLLRGTVRRPPNGVTWTVPVHAVVAFSNEQLTSERTLSLDDARALYTSLGVTATFHQQGQYYGDYVGRVDLGRGEARTIAAPGSWAYHGSDYRGNSDPWEKQAAYWVTIRITLDPLSAAALASGRQSPTLLRIATSNNFGDPRAVHIRTLIGNSVTNYDPGDDIPWVPSMNLLVTFLGTSETQLELAAF